jgi:hypothetical protein
MRLKKLIIQAVLASVLVIGFGLTAMTGGQASSYNKPALTDASVKYAKATTEILQSRLIAALGQEFGSTTRETAANATDAISLIFNDKNHNMRLVGTVGPLRENDYPEDQFEQKAVAKVLNEQIPFTTSIANPIDAIDGAPGQWYYRRAIAVDNKTLGTSCVLCHANYAFLPANKQTVGVLALKVPIK